TTAIPQTTASAINAAGELANAKPASTAHVPLASMAHDAMRALPRRSAKRPATADPTAPLAIVRNASADPNAELGGASPCVATCRLAAANAGIHVHTAYSSHMWPRYPSVASRAGRYANTRTTARGSNRALVATYGPSPTATSTMTPPASARPDADSISVLHGMFAEAAASRWGNADPTVSAPMRMPSAAPRWRSNQP